MFICALLVYYFLRWKKNHIQVRAMELNYNLLEEDYNDLDIRHEETKEDRSKLQKAWIVQLSDVTLEVVIGKGAFGEVWKGNWRGMDVALKKMFPETISAEYYSDITNVGRNTTGDNNNDNNELNKVALAMLENLEVGAMMRLRHPRIVAFLGAGEIVDPPLHRNGTPRVGIFVMLEFAAGGDLTQRLAAAAETAALLPWKDRLQCAMDIAKGMAYIHSEGFIHRDLKSLNVLCDQHGRCMIADLGLACLNTSTSEQGKEVALTGAAEQEMMEIRQLNRLIELGMAENTAPVVVDVENGTGSSSSSSSSSSISISSSSSSSVGGSSGGSGSGGGSSSSSSSKNKEENKTMWAGSAAWIAPEVTVLTDVQNFKKFSQYGFKADVFSFGMVLYELLTCRIPWSGTDKRFTSEIMQAVVAGERPPIGELELGDAPFGFVALMRKCWDTEADKRPLFADVLLELEEICHQ